MPDMSDKCPSSVRRYHHIRLSRDVIGLKRIFYPFRTDRFQQTAMGEIEEITVPDLLTVLDLLRCLRSNRCISLQRL